MISKHEGVVYTKKGSQNLEWYTKIAVEEDDSLKKKNELFVWKNVNKAIISNFDFFLDRLKN